MSELNFYYRDTSLSNQLIDLYKNGQIITERGFTDMSYLGGGLAMNLRYLIASSNAKDVAAFHPDSAECGHVMLPSNASFKVLDNYRMGDKTQIFLLEISDGENPETLLTQVQEAELIQHARMDFDTKMKMAPVRALQSLDWKERTEFPIGMNGAGEFFSTALNSLS